MPPHPKAWHPQWQAPPSHPSIIPTNHTQHPRTCRISPMPVASMKSGSLKGGFSMPRLPCGAVAAERRCGACISSQSQALRARRVQRCTAPPHAAQQTAACTPPHEETDLQVLALLGPVPRYRHGVAVRLQQQPRGSRAKRTLAGQSRAGGCSAAHKTAGPKDISGVEWGRAAQCCPARQRCNPPCRQPQQQ